MSKIKSNLGNQSLPELKRTAKALGINGTKDWTENDYRKAIGSRQRNRVVARVVDDVSKPLEPGYARIEIQHHGEDASAPVPINYNGSFTAIIPLNTVVDLPWEVVDSCLGHATKFSHSKKKGADGQDHTTTELALAYPYREYDRDDSVSVVPTTRTKEAQGVREKFKAIRGRWPKSAEARQFADKLNELKFEQMLTGDIDPEIRELLGLPRLKTDATK
jgi:hypothetical protein